MHETPITDIETDPYHRQYLYAALYGHGYWLYDYGSDPGCPP